MVTSPSAKLIPVATRAPDPFWVMLGLITFTPYQLSAATDDSVMLVALKIFKPVHVALLKLAFGGSLMEMPVRFFSDAGIRKLEKSMLNPVSAAVCVGVPE